MVMGEPTEEEKLRGNLGIATYEERLYEAANCYLGRKDRIEHPDGDFDKGGRWYPSDAELRPCCGTIRQPSRGYPYSLMLHCRTLAHIAHLFDVKASDIKAKLIPVKVAKRLLREE